MATEAAATVRRILELRDRTRERLGRDFGRRSGSALKMLDSLFTSPLISVRDAIDLTRLTQPAANRLVNDLAQAGVLREVTGRKRDRLFRFDSYLELFAEREDLGRRTVAGRSLLRFRLRPSHPAVKPRPPLRVPLPGGVTQ